MDKRLSESSGGDESSKKMALTSSDPVINDQAQVDVTNVRNLRFDRRADLVFCSLYQEQPMLMKESNQC